MKRFLRLTAVLASAAMLMTAAACSGNEEAGSEDDAPVVISGGQAEGGSGKAVPADDAGKKAEAGEVFYWEYSGLKLIVNGEVSKDDVMALPGSSEPFESDSCAFQGKDKVYTFPSFYLRTYPTDGKDYVSSIEFRDDTVQTDKGIYIGCTKSDVIEKYGEPSADNAGGLDYVKGDSMLSFVIADDVVTSIMYSAVF